MKARSTPVASLTVEEITQGHGLPLGGGVQAVIHAVTATPHPTSVNPTAVIEAQVTLRAEIGVDDLTRCACCGRLPEFPYGDADRLLHVLRTVHHQAIAWTRADGSTASGCPTVGWAYFDASLVCGACKAQLDAAVQAVRLRCQR